MTMMSILNEAPPLPPRNHTLKRSWGSGSRVSINHKKGCVIILCFLLALATLRYHQLQLAVVTSSSENQIQMEKMIQMPRHEESISSPTKSQSHITKTTSNRKTNSTSMGKPLLVLHVGPRKTGTTTIQMSLGFDDSIKRTMRQDNFTIVNFNYLKFKALIKSCFDRKDECDEKRGGWNHLKMLYRIATRSTNAIHSVENYSTIPSDPYTIERIRSLQELYIIRVIIVYRPAHEWLISAYAQYEKWLLYNTRMQVWADWNDKQKRPRSSFTEYFDQFFPDHITDSLHTYDLFSKIFGSDAISVMSMPPGNALKEEFFCRALQNEAPKTCSAVVAENKKSPEESNHNPSSHFLFEEDRLILR